MLWWLGGVFYRARWVVLLIGFGFVIAGAIYGSQVTNFLDTGLGGDADTQSQQAQNIFDKQLSVTRVDVIILFKSADLQVADPAYQAAINQALAPLQHISNIASVVSYYNTGDPGLISQDGHETFVTVRFKNLNDKLTTWHAIEAQVQPPPAFTLQYGGTVPGDEEFSNQVATDLSKMEDISFPIVAIALLLVFDGVIAAALPLVLGGIAIAGALAVLRLLTHFTDISIYAVNIVSLLGLGLAIDYSLFIVTRFREEMARDPADVQGALQRTMATAGRTVLFSGLTVSTSLIGLTLFPLVSLRSQGIGSIAAVLVAMVSALTILPVGLAIIGKRINSLSPRRLLRRVFANRAAPQLDLPEQYAQAGNEKQPVLRVILPTLIIVLGFMLLQMSTLQTILAVVILCVAGGLLVSWESLLAGGVAIAAGLLMLQVAQMLPGISIHLASLIALVTLGLAVDYALIISTRYNAEIESDPTNVLLALRRTLIGEGRIVLFSAWAFVTIVLTLHFFSIPGFTRELEIAAVLGVLVATVTAMAVLPAILSILRPVVSAFSFKSIFASAEARQQAQEERSEHEGAWYRLSQLVMRYPIAVMVGVFVVLISLGSPFIKVNFAAPDIRALPTSKSARQVYDRISADFVTQTGSQQTIAVLTKGNVLTPANLTSLYNYVAALRNVPNVARVDSVVSTNPQLPLSAYEAAYADPGSNPNLTELAQQIANGNATKVTVTVNSTDTSQVTQNVVRNLRTVTPPAGFTVYVGGNAANQVDLFDNMKSAIVPAILTIVLSTLVLLFLMTGSLIVPIKAIILNFFSLTATFGTIVFVFQEGHGHELLGFESLGSIDPSQLMILFAIAFGLSMDYEVFLLSRIKEQYDKTGNNRLAVATGLQHTGWLITSAALLLAIVLLATVTSEIVFIKQIGLGLAIAVLMDATLVRALLVPATMRLLGNWNWWPRAHTFGEGSSHDLPVATPSLPAYQPSESILPVGDADGLSPIAHS